MRKVDSKYLDPIENIITDIGDYVIPWFKAYGHTPNMLTTYSFLLGAAAVYHLYYDNYTYFASCFALSFAFDCWDGHMARAYNMTSKFGDLYDHVTDVAVDIMLLYVVYVKYKNQLTIPVIVIFLLMTYLMNKHIGCYQKMYMELEKGEQETLDTISKLCPNTDDIRWSRFFGPGVYNIIFIIGIIYYFRSKTKLSEMTGIKDEFN